MITSIALAVALIGSPNGLYIIIIHCPSSKVYISKK